MRGRYARDWHVIGAAMHVIGTEREEVGGPARGHKARDWNVIGYETPITRDWFPKEHPSGPAGSWEALGGRL